MVLLEDKDALVANAEEESSRIMDEKNMNDKIAFMIGRGELSTRIFESLDCNLAALSVVVYA